MNYSIYLICLLLPLISFAKVDLIEDRSGLSVKTPSLREVEKLKMKLGNGLEVYLISDPGIDQSAAGYSTRVGSWNDPESYNGMAHFTEHMLFMGSEAYPDEQGFNQFVADHQGSLNAHTGSDYTTYMFTINHDAFSVALDQFAHFFIDPLMPASAVARELHAVDQESEKNIENDDWREQLLFNSLCVPSHPVHKFSCGNKEILSRIPLEELKQWFKHNYSADNSRLVILSRAPLSDLKQLVETSFSKIPQASIAPLPYTKITAPATGHIVYFKPIKDKKQLTLIFELPPSIGKDLESHPANLVAYVMGAEHPLSLSQLLKKQGLAEKIEVGCEEMSMTHSLFTVQIKLTEAGVKDLNQAIESFFGLVSSLKQTGIPPYLFDEYCRLNELRFEYQSRPSPFQYVMEAAESMFNEPLATYPRMNLLPTQYNPKAILATLECLHPKNGVFIAVASPELTKQIPDQKEKWYHGEYKLYQLSEDTLKDWAATKPHPELALAPPNPYIPGSMEVFQNAEQLTLLTDSPQGKCYYSPLPSYEEPKVSFLFHFKSPMIDGSAKSNALLDLYTRCFKEELSATLDQASAAGLFTSLSRQKMGLTLSLGGFSEKAPALTKTVMSSLQSINPSAGEFEIYKQSLLASYGNQDKELLFYQAIFQMQSTLQSNAYTPEEMLSALTPITYDEFLLFKNALFQKGYVEGVLTGNLKEDEAKELYQTVLSSLNSLPYPKSEHLSRKILELPKAGGPYRIDLQTGMQGNATILMIDLGDHSFDKEAAHQVAASALKVSFFEELRTKQQVGYLVHSVPQELEGKLMQWFIVQSADHPPQELLIRFEIFLEAFTKDFETEIPEGRFESIKGEMIAKLREPKRTLGEKSTELFTEAFQYNGDFGRREKQIKALSALSYDTFKGEMETFLSRKNLRRLAILIEGPAQTSATFAYEPMTLSNIKERGAYIAR
ncbi:MAG: insulinase family protein [Simkaniaceae bacterium]|nr:insulinase family protein [Simkaniaceae bacterium]